jgi:hypothetical protein
VHPLPTWLTHFEDYEEELLTEFCPPSENSSPSTSTFHAMVRVEFPSEHLPECPPLNMAPLFGFADSGYAGIHGGGWCSEEDEDFDEEDEDYDPFEFDIDSDFGSESSAPASYGAEAFDWPTPSQGQVADWEGYSRANAVTLFEFPPQDTPSPPPSSPHVPSFDSFDLPAQPPNSLPWSVFTNPFTDAPITTSPALASVAPTAEDNSADGRVDLGDADRFLAEMEEGLGIGSGPGSLPESFKVEVEGWYDRFDLTGYTFPVLPQQPQSPRMAAGLEAPPLVYTTTVPLPDTEEGEDAELDVVVIPRSPPFGWR